MGTHSGMAVRTNETVEVWEKGMDGFDIVQASKDWLAEGPNKNPHPDPETIGTSGYTHHHKVEGIKDWKDVWDSPGIEQNLEMEWEYFLLIDHDTKLIELPSPMGSLSALAKIAKPWEDAGWTINL